MLIAIIVLFVSAAATWICGYLLLSKINELREQLEYLTKVHNHNVNELVHRSEQLQEVKVVEL